MAGQLLSQLASFVGQVWQANGDAKKLDEAGRTLADAIGIMAAAALLAIAAHVLKKGGEFLSKTRFAEKVGKTELARWLADRARMESTREVLTSKPPATKPPIPAMQAGQARGRGATASGTGKDFNLEEHAAPVREPVVEKRRGGARPPTPDAPARPVEAPPELARGDTAEDILSVHGEATEGTGRAGRSPSDPEELNTWPDRRTVDPEEVEQMSPRYEGDRFDAKMTEEDLALVAQELFPQYRYDPATKGKVVYRSGKPTRTRSKGSTVPDLYLRGRRAQAGDPRLAPISLEAKNYHLGDVAAYDEFLSATLKQARQRAAALPKSAQQHLIIDLRGQTPPAAFMERLRVDLVQRSGGLFRADRIHFLTSGSP